MRLDRWKKCWGALWRCMKHTREKACFSVRFSRVGQRGSGHTLLGVPEALVPQSPVKNDFPSLYDTTKPIISGTANVNFDVHRTFRCDLGLPNSITASEFRQVQELITGLQNLGCSNTTGEGQTLCIMSDSFDRSGSATRLQASGDLPENVDVVKVRTRRHPT